MHEDPTKDPDYEKPLEEMTASERKKAKQAARKKAKKEEEALSEKKEDGKTTRPRRKNRKPDEDPLGKKLGSVANPLDEGLKFVQKLETDCEATVESCLVSLFEHNMHHTPSYPHISQIY